MNRRYIEALPGDIRQCLMDKGPMSAASICCILNPKYSGNLNPQLIASICKTLIGQGTIGFKRHQNNSTGGTYYAIRD